jgi:hypothetical protein
VYKALLLPDACSINVSSFLKIEVTSSSETWIDFQLSVRYYIAENIILQNSLKHILNIYFGKYCNPQK